MPSPARPAHPARRAPARLGPQPSRPGTTLRSLHLTLTEIGPRTADLALVAERARFAADDRPEVLRPTLAVWRALIADVGPGRALALMLNRGDELSQPDSPAAAVGDRAF